MTETVNGQSVDTWVRCPSCEFLLYRNRLCRNLHVCPECHYHWRLHAATRIEQLVDPGTFEPAFISTTSADVLGFTDTRPYVERLAAARDDTGLDEAVISGKAEICGLPVVLAVMDFRFMGGSLGAGVGEIITQAAEAALRARSPFVVVTASGGARMQEGCLSLMQMAKTSQALARLNEAGLLSISVVTDPTYGGVAASFATNTDVIVAESGARLGFAGPRVIQQTIRQELPPGFQTAEFLLEHGQVDVVEERRGLRSCLARILAVGQVGHGHQPPAPVPPGSILHRNAEDVPQEDPWLTVQAARHADRPTMLDYASRVFDSFIELHGDRLQGDCSATVAGLARLGGTPLVVVGQQKGHTTKELAARNFGMPRPEGYRKSLRLMRLAARLGIPIVALVDTPGAYPGLAAEEHGQAAAIAENLLHMSSFPVPIVTVVTGEGGSGGALALAVADRVLMTANSIYSVISPEGCSAILWGGAHEAPQAARALRITAGELLRLGITEAIVPEPEGGAQADHAGAALYLRRALIEALTEVSETEPSVLVEQRRRRFRSFGQGVAMPVQQSNGGGDRGGR